MWARRRAKRPELMQINRLIREPLLHFFVLGALLFFLFAWTNEDAMQGPDEIVVDAQRIKALRSQFERVWQRPPTPDEISGLVDNWVREEVLYREGLALGLDQGDPILRRRVAQKVEFISEELIDAQPTDEELQTYFADHADDYRLDPRLTFRQIYFNPAVQGAALDATIETALDAARQGQVAVGDATLLPSELDDVSLTEVRRTFGDRFAEALSNAPVGEWAGPVASGYGLHLVLIDDRQQARVPAFDEVRAAVQRDFVAARTREVKDAFYETLRQRYTVTFEDGVTLADQRDVAGAVE
jgi:hypothetical protein